MFLHPPMRLPIRADTYARPAPVVRAHSTCKIILSLQNYKNYLTFANFSATILHFRTYFPLLPRILLNYPPLIFLLCAAFLFICRIFQLSATRSFTSRLPFPASRPCFTLFVASASNADIGSCEPTLNFPVYSDQRSALVILFLISV